MHVIATDPETDICLCSPSTTRSQPSNEQSTSRAPIGPSKWAWSGDLIYGTADKAEPLCQVNMSDPSDKAVTGFKLKQMLYGRDSLRFSKTYTRWEMRKIHRALDGVEQFARLSYKEDKDIEAFMAFVQYLEGRNLVGIVSASFNSSSRFF